MRKWFLPLTVLGLGGLGAALFTERGRNVISSLFERGSKGSLSWRESRKRSIESPNIWIPDTNVSLN